MNKVLLITGASSNIGISLIQSVINECDMIVAHYYRENNELQKIKECYPEKIELLQADFGDAVSVRRMINQIKDKEIPVNQIIHLVSSKFEQNRFTKMNIEKFYDAMQISLYSILEITQEFVGGMSKNQYGKIIFMLTSYVEHIPPRFLSTYVVSKYALLGLQKSLATEYASKGITVNAVSPEMIETNFLKDIPEYIIENSAK